jgi:hypothetical protein
VGDHRTKRGLRDREGVRIGILALGRRRGGDHKRTRDLTGVCVCCPSQALRPWSRRFPGNLTSANLVTVGTRGSIPSLYVSMNIVHDETEHSFFNRI